MRQFPECHCPFDPFDSLPYKDWCPICVRKNGRPPEGAHIAVYSADEYLRYVSIDEDGRFNFILYGDFDYSIEARDYIDEIEGRSQRIKIPQVNSSALKLVIQRIKP